ncbi:MAG: hypothetical protein KAH26_05495 [Bacteroidales bacterium]|nr:hypothetical protein [Bacteroidales bacterium]
MIKKYLKIKQEYTDAAKARGARQLIRLEVMIDVLFALMIYKLFTFMPNPDVDGFGRDELYKVLTESYLNYTVIFIGLVLVIIYWGMNNLQFGNLDRTDGKHATLSILQVFSLMLYIYFVRLDAQFEGEIFLMQLQSTFLALAGFLSVASWHYAIKNGLVSEDPTELEKEKMYIKLLPEPIVSVLTFPLAYFGPLAWTLGWLLLIPVGYLSKVVQKRMKGRKN